MTFKAFLHTLHSKKSLVQNPLPAATSRHPELPKPTLRRHTNYTVLISMSLLAIVAYVDLSSQQLSTAGTTKTTAKTSDQGSALTLNQLSSAATPVAAAAVSASADATTEQSSSTVTGTDPLVQVTVNGQDVNVPDNGSTTQAVPTTDGTGQTDVSVSSNQSSTTGTGRNYSLTTTHTTVTSNSTNDNASFSIDTNHSTP
jgi:hypothetical protein